MRRKREPAPPIERSDNQADLLRRARAFDEAALTCIYETHPRSFADSSRPCAVEAAPPGR